MRNIAPYRLSHRLETHGRVTSQINTNIFANDFILTQINRVKKTNPRFSFRQDAETPCEEAEVMVTHQVLFLLNIKRYIKETN